jgi:poly(A) polymerase Pap1
MINSIFLCECYKCVRTWANLKNIYGSKYGFLNGISWLYLTLNLFIKENFKNKKLFFKKFIEFYNQYDWNIPININNKIIEKINPSDNIIYISSLNINKTNIVRNISNNTFKIILNEFKIANEFSLENINEIFIKKKIKNKYFKITINDQFEFNRIDKKNKISSEIWKLNIKNNFIPTSYWSEKNNTFIYKIEINEFTNIEELTNYFKKFNVLCEIKNL